MGNVLDPDIHATVKQATTFLNRSRMTVMRRIASGELASRLVKERGARKIRAIKWEDLAEARYGPDHPPVMTEEQVLTEAMRSGEAITAVLRPSGQWQMVGPGYAMASVQDPPAQVENAKLRMLETIALDVSAAAARLQDGDVTGAERAKMTARIQTEARLAARLANEITPDD